LRLTKLVKGVSANNFRAENRVLDTSYYIDPEIYASWSGNIAEMRTLEGDDNAWNKLYVKQNGMCTACKSPLGYLNERTLEIHHVEQVSKLSSKDPLLKSTENLVLLHKECHKAIPINYSK